jgi:hypothetical protein
MSKKVSYLRTYPVQWPIFSTKNYVKDVDGWWNPIKKNKRKNNVFDKFENTNTNIYEDKTIYENKNVLNVPGTIIIK